MRVAYISSAFLADCDLPLLHAMHRRGIEVYYFLQMSDKSRQATLINVSQMKSSGGVFPSSEYRELAHLSKWLPLNRIFVVNMPKPKDLSKQSVRAVWHLRCYIQKLNPDVIHITSPLRYGSFLLYLERKRMVLTVHDPLPHSSDIGLLNRFHRWVAFHTIKHFIVLSESLKNVFISTYQLPSENVYLSRLGIYTHLQRVPSAELKLPQRYISFVGSINPHKGIRYLCEAMLQVHKEDPSLHLIIAGRGKFDFDIQSYSDKGYIHVINRFVTDSELSTIIGRSQFVCCPYKDATQSGVIMSSFALRKPVLATRTGALYEMLEDGKHGILVPPCDSKALARAIISLLHGDTLSVMSDNIRLDYESGLQSWDSIALGTIQIYQKVQRI